MENIKKETKLSLTNDQLQTVINQHIGQGKGIQDLFAMTLNAWAVSERKVFLENDKNENNKANGYRQIKKTCIGSKISNVPYPNHLVWRLKSSSTQRFIQILPIRVVFFY